MSQLSTERYSEKLAPGSLVLVQELLNTRGAGKPRLLDLLSDTSAATTWLSRALNEWSRSSGTLAPDVQVDDAGLVRLQQLRALLQVHLAGAVRDEPPTSAARGLQGKLVLRLGADGEMSSEPDGDGVSWVISAVLTEVSLAHHLGTLRRLKTCRNDVCSVAFYDRTNNNNRVWHDVHICGNAINLRASRRRRAERVSDTPAP